MIREDSPPDRTDLICAVIHAINTATSAYLLAISSGLESFLWQTSAVVNLLFSIRYLRRWATAFFRSRRQQSLQAYRHVCNDSCKCQKGNSGS